jgi:heptosyltransferase-2
MSEAGTVLLVAPNWLGDAVMALPAMADIKRHFDASKVVVAARRPVAGLFRLAPAIDAIVELEWRGGLLRRQGLADDVARIRRVTPSVSILFPNSFAAAWLTRLADVPQRWGYATDLRGGLLSRAVRRPRGGVHQAAYYRHLVRQLGIETGPFEQPLIVPATVVEEGRRLLVDRGWDPGRPLVVIAPGAAYGTAKRWLPRHFAALSARLIRERQAHVALVGSAADRDTVAQVVAGIPPETQTFITDLAGATSLETLAGVLRLARICVSNDSGTMHVAAAVGAPLAALFGPTREHETGPLAAPGANARVLLNPVWCRPCMLRECPIDHRCMKGLRPESVFEAVSGIMR